MISLQQKVFKIQNITSWFNGPHGPQVVFWAALVLLVHSLAQWTWAVLTPAPAAYPNAQSLTASTKSPQNLSLLLSADLFGPTPASFQPGSNDNAPVSGLNLVLTGVVAAGPQSLALIRVQGQAPEPFSLDQEITPGVVLKEVQEDRAVIQRGGIKESLLLGGVDTPKRLAPVQKVNPKRFVVPKQVIREQMKSPDFLLQGNLVPLASGGFEVRSVQKGSLLENLGLKKGQVIRSVNGQPLNSPQDVMGLFQRLNSLGQIQLDVLTNGQLEKLTYDLQ